MTDEEAAALLTAARNYVKPPREGQQLADAKRWVPWLTAHTGCRVTEATALRKEDIREREGIPYVRITATKTGSFQDVPIHRQLIEEGFLEFVKAAPAGPLFYTGSARTSTEHPAAQVSKRLATWIRSLGLIEDSINPNHGWRHRFKTIGREVEIDPRILDAIQGHAARTSGENHGDVTLRAKASAVMRMPALPVHDAMLRVLPEGNLNSRVDDAISVSEIKNLAQFRQ